MSKWELFRIGDVCSIISGNSLPEDICNKKGDIPYIKVSDMNLYENTPLITTSSRYVFRDDVKKQIFPKGTVIFPKRGGAIGTNKKRLTLREICADLNIMGIIPGQKVDSRYLFMFFQNIDLDKLSNGSSVPQINNGDISPLKLPLPPLNIQKQIADTLDKASRLIELRKTQLEKMNLLIKSKFIEMFGDPVTNPKGWPLKSLSQVADIDTRMTVEFEKYADLPHIGIDSIERNTGNIVDFDLVKNCGLISGKYLFDERHIIYSKIRPNLNKVALPTFNGLCSADAYPILPLQKEDRYYLAYILRSDFFLNYIMKHSDRTNIPKANKQQLYGFHLPMPPSQLTAKFMEFCKTIECQMHLVQRGIERMRSLYNALMQEYFP